MLSLIVKQFLRSRAVIVTLALILMLGMLSILIGRQFLIKEEQNIEAVTRHQQEHIERNVQYHLDNIGGLLYYVRFAFINKPDRLAALSIGQRDINPGVQHVTIRALEAQKYDTDLNNPANQLSGNLDLGFVIIYLFPLVIIAITFNLLSEEREHGTWRMVAVQSRFPLRFLLIKLFVRALAIYAVLILLLLIAIFILTLPLNGSLLAFFALSMLYLLFWFSLSFAVLSFGMSSNFNALVMLSLWIVLSILLPAVANNYIIEKYPIPEALSTIIKQRDGYHQKWDTDRKQTMEKFYQHYPQFRRYGVPEGEFTYSWYYAMQQMGDDESREYSKAMREKIIQREKLSRRLSLFVPGMHTQMAFADLAGASLLNHLMFIDQTTAFHERMRLHFYPRIFEHAPVNNEDWNDFQPEYAKFDRPVNWGDIMLPVLIGFLAMGVIVVWNIRSRNIA